MQQAASIVRQSHLMFARGLLAANKEQLRESLRRSRETGEGPPPRSRSQGAGTAIPNADDIPPGEDELTVMMRRDGYNV